MQTTVSLSDFWLLDAAAERVLSSTLVLRQPAKTAAENINFRQLPEDLWRCRFDSLKKLLELELISLRSVPGGKYCEPEILLSAPSEAPFGDQFSYEAVCTPQGGNVWETIVRPSWDRYCGGTWSPFTVEEYDGTLAELSVIDGGSQQAVEDFLKSSDFVDCGGDRTRTLVYSGNVRDWQPRHWKRDDLEGWVGVFRTKVESPRLDRGMEPEPKFPVWRQVGFNPSSRLILEDPDWKVVVDI